MKNSCAWMTMGVVILAAAICRGQDSGIPQPLPTDPTVQTALQEPPPMPPAGEEGKMPEGPPPVAGQQPVPESAAPGQCCDQGPETCLPGHCCNLKDWLCYRSARTPCCCGCAPPYAKPPLYAYFLDHCHGCNGGSCAGQMTADGPGYGMAKQGCCCKVLSFIGCAIQRPCVEGESPRAVLPP